MAQGTITEAVQSGQMIRVAATVDEDAAGEGLTGIQTYTADVAISDLKVAGSAAARKALITAALTTVRDTYKERVVIEGQLDNLLGTTVTI